ncbi:hypothetical protein K2173_018524 [Erythroxylum novogranatense]|uniref:Peptide N-acetyl-beta-D-glucosaminyl asparaginase amidase A N-terminal domain-containing protein n=1 Tax=Erythroxylum novogranatense TaxID=1862640 RepID=A0AAV8UAP7_9ROSI|nr:hypothetical protein K2173_018524 [Erythroxylum novogranatense]
MAVCSYTVFFTSIILFLLHPLPTYCNIHKTNRLLGSYLLTQPKSGTTITNEFVQPINDSAPTVFFEVTKPIETPKTKPYIHHVLQHDFGNTYGRPSVIANYTPPCHCRTNDFSTIVLEWKATCKGRQFDRIFGVWLGGVELLRSCTAEPKASGIVWTVEKDITRYSSLLLKNETQIFSVFLANVVDNTYTGVYHVNITLYFYPTGEKKHNHIHHKGSSNDLISSIPNSNADLILPISKSIPLNDGLWFKIENSTDIESKEFKIPPNVYRAVLEVYVSFHETDEFWYGNVPTEYIVTNNLTGTPGNGPFREIVVSLDGEAVGAIWPFTVIHTGGINPLLWRPISGIGSFNLPSYDIEITPFLGSLLDFNTHHLGFSVTNGLNVWFVDANLHLWLDHNSKKTVGKLLKHEIKPVALSSSLTFEGLNGTFLTRAHRSISSNGWVASSHGNITTHSYQNFHYKNFMKIGKDGNSQIVKQLIHMIGDISSKKPSSCCQELKQSKDFLLNLYSDELDQGNGTSFYVTNITLGFNEKKASKYGGFRSVKSSLKNLQDAQGVMIVENNLVINGLASTQQLYKYKDTKFCYERDISSSNYTIIHDKVGHKCK